VRAYLTRFWLEEAAGRWPYVTIVGNSDAISAGQEAALREAVAWVERIKKR
jgi:hypothetical protein